jgi:hypothetical protein
MGSSRSRRRREGQSEGFQGVPGVVSERSPPGAPSVLYGDDPHEESSLRRPPRELVEARRGVGLEHHPAHHDLADDLTGPDGLSPE